MSIQWIELPLAIFGGLVIIVFGSIALSEWWTGTKDPYDGF